MPTKDGLTIPENVAGTLRTILTGWRNLKLSPEIVFTNAELHEIWYWAKSTHMRATRKVMYRGRECEVRLRSLGNPRDQMLQLTIVNPIARTTVVKLNWYSTGDFAVVIGRKNMSNEMWDHFLPSLQLLADEAKV